MMPAEPGGRRDRIEIGRALRRLDQRAGFPHGSGEPLLDGGRVRPGSACKRGSPRARPRSRWRRSARFRAVAAARGSPAGNRCPSSSRRRRSDRPPLCPGSRGPPSAGPAGTRRWPAPRQVVSLVSPSRCAPYALTQENGACRGVLHSVRCFQSPSPSGKRLCDTRLGCVAPRRHREAPKAPWRSIRMHSVLHWIASLRPK